MNKNMEWFTSYLQAVDIISKPFIEQVRFIYGICCEICPEKLEDIFVTNYTVNNGIVEYENLWFFSKSYCLEAKQFLTKNDVDITPIMESIKYWTMQMEDYNFKKATANSKLMVRCATLQGVDLDFRAEGKNCDYLKNIIDKYVKPNLIE